MKTIQTGHGVGYIDDPISAAIVATIGDFYKKKDVVMI